jgi:hypothetical protein
MRKNWFVVVLTVAALGGLAQTASAQQRWTAVLSGQEEVPPISSPASGVFNATVESDGSISFTLTFEGLSAPPTFSHIHFGQPGVAGGVMIFLCGGGGQADCPAATSGTVQGAIRLSNVTGPAAQGIDPGQLFEAVQAVVQGEGYVNIHNTRFPPGEIRGQVKIVPAI